jgi:hypothetical protein
MLLQFIETDTKFICGLYILFNVFPSPIYVIAIT